MEQGSARSRRRVDAQVSVASPVGAVQIDETDRQERTERRFRRAWERRGKGARRIDSVARRALDVLFAATVLLITAPALMLVALAIVIESPGPVFYRAERVGRRGRRLRMLKFRKMWDGAKGIPLTADADQRLTRIGILLTRTRLDEMPQLWHVLRGEMSLVGPRPEDPGFVAAHAIAYERILSVRPGLTGFAQLAFADERRILSTADPMGDYLGRILPQKCRLDLLYIRERSVLTNLRIMLWTVGAILLRCPVAVNRATGRLNFRRRIAPAAARHGRRLRRSLSTPLEPAAVAGAEGVRALHVVADPPPPDEDPQPPGGRSPRPWAVWLTGPLRRRGDARRARRLARRAPRVEERLAAPAEECVVEQGARQDVHTEVGNEGSDPGGGNGDAFASLHDGDPQAARSGR
jgi:lipopolysaccharide/colanic/teichoic acid biosynthesis glycosyltransferase